MSVHQKKNGTWFVQYRMPETGKLKREYIGVGEKNHELAIRRDIEIKYLKEQEKELEDEEEDDSEIYLDELAQAYVTDRQISGRSENWLKNIQYMLNRSILPFLNHKPVSSLSYIEILKVIEEQYAHAALITKQHKIASLRAIFNFGVEQKVISKNPLKKWRKRKTPRRPLLLTVSKLQRISDHALPHLQWALKVAWETAARPGVTELFAMKYIYADYDNNLLRIPGTKTGNSDRYVPITDDFKKDLIKREKLSQSGFLMEYKGKPVVTLAQSFNTAQRNAGLKHKHRMYDIRHLCATTMLANGADLAAVSRFLGHASVLTTQRVYYHVMPGAMRDAATLRPPLTSRKKEPNNKD